jgi:hypothetical protein
VPGVFGRFNLLEETGWGVFLVANFEGAETGVFGGSALLEEGGQNGVGLLGKVDLTSVGVPVGSVEVTLLGTGTFVLLGLVEGMVSLWLFLLDPDWYPRLFLLFLFFFCLFLLLWE